MTVCQLNLTYNEVSTLYEALGIAADWITEGLDVGGYDDEQKEEECERLQKVNDLYRKVEKTLFAMIHERREQK